LQLLATWRLAQNPAPIGVLMNPSSIRRSLAVAALAVSFACATGTPYSQVEATLPPPPSGQGRVILYMATGEVGWWPTLSIDGAVLGKLKPGTFFYVDRSVGPHQIEVPPDPHLAAFGNQGATTPVTLLVQTGQSAYVQVTVVATPGMITAVLTPEESADAQRDLSHLDLVPPAAP
jgi:hypothetical protein